jgi:hypothetical protein
MDAPSHSDRQADAINEAMVRQMERRRQERQERRRPSDRAASPPRADRRKTCAYCFQPGDHPTAAHCLRALERA